jgi:hypothetical protein
MSGQWKKSGPFFRSPGGRLYREGVGQLELKGFDKWLLGLLWEHAETVVSNAEIDRWWQGGGQQNTRHKALERFRSKLGNNYVETVHGVGCRWTAPVADAEPPRNLLDLDRVQEPRVVAAEANRFTGVEWHPVFVFGIATLYALHQCISEAAELIFLTPAFAGIAWTMLPVGFAISFASATIALWLDYRLVPTNRVTALGLALVVAVVGSAFLAIRGWLALPEEVSPLSPLSMPARVGFLKSCVVYPAFLLISFVVLPFHAILEREAGLASSTLGPTNRWYFLGAIALVAVPLTLHLLSTLDSSVRSDYFGVAAVVRLIFWFGTAALSLHWYATTLGMLEAPQR